MDNSGIMFRGRLYWRGIKIILGWRYQTDLEQMTPERGGESGVRSYSGGEDMILQRGMILGEMILK